MDGLKQIGGMDDAPGKGGGGYGTMRRHTSDQHAFMKGGGREGE